MNSLRRTAAAVAVAGASLVGGVVGASLIGTAGAQSDGNSTTTTEQAATPAQPAAPTRDQQAPDQDQDGRGPGNGQDPFGPGGHQANGITEEVLTGDAAAKVTAAAEQAVDGGTVVRVETDAEGAEYEAHVRSSDGSPVTVKLDASFNVTGVEDGMR